MHDTAIQHGMPLVDLFCWAHGDGGPLHDAVDGGYGLYYYADTDRILHYNDSDSDFIKTNKTLSGIIVFGREIMESSDEHARFLPMPWIHSFYD